ncbi:MAG: peptidoglycan DD-metalloendopeptidase family protein [Candidatus Promineifilaceae bacterium]
MRTITTWIKVNMRNLRLILTAVILLLVILVLARWLLQNRDMHRVEVVDATSLTPTPEGLDPIKTATVTEADVPTISPIATTPRAKDTPLGSLVEQEEKSTPEPVDARETPSAEVQVTGLFPSPTPPIRTPSPGPTVNLYASSDAVDRTCPEPSPAKPDYYHYYLSGTSWPAPDPEKTDHFWLTELFEGGDRFLITEWFPYGYDVGGRYLIHNGIDMAEPQGTPILAASDGTVVVAGDDSTALYGWRCDWYGHLVVIELDDRWQGEPVFVLYGHVQNVSVEVGQSLERGETVAEVGVGGAATRPHLHFEVRVGENTFGATRNPLLWLPPPTTRGLIAGRLVDPGGRPWQGVTLTAIGRSDGTSNHTSWTYLGDPELLVNPDERLAENFVISDMEPGQYELIVSLQGVTYNQEVEVESGKLTVVEIVTESYKTPTATPQPGG